jgi:hypothetical protein
VAGVGVVHRRGHVLPVVGERRRDLLRRRDHDRGRVPDQLERRAKRLDRQNINNRRRARLRLRRRRVGQGQLGELTVLERQLGRRVELDPLGLAKRTLGEGRKPADRLDLVAEQLQARGPVLGRPEDVEDVAADRELAPIVDLLGAFVAGLDQELGDVAEVDLLALVQGEARRAQRGVGNGLGERHRRGDDDRRLVARRRLGRERVEGPDAQAHQMRRRREVGLVARPARRVVADPPRRQIGADRAGEVAGADVVCGDDQRRASRESLLGIEQRGEQIRTDRAGGAQVDRLARPNPGREVGEPLVFERYVQQRPEQSGEVSDRE